MRLRPQLLEALPAGHLRPPRRRARVRVLRVGLEVNGGEVLQQADDHERHLVVRVLLPEADARAGVEREEDERVAAQVRLLARVEEAVGVELERVGAPHVRAPVHHEDGVHGRCAGGDVDGLLGGVG